MQGLSRRFKFWPRKILASMLIVYGLSALATSACFDSVGKIIFKGSSNAPYITNPDPLPPYINKNKYLVKGRGPAPKKTSVGVTPAEVYVYYGYSSKAIKLTEVKDNGTWEGSLDFKEGYNEFKLYAKVGSVTSSMKAYAVTVDTHIPDPPSLREYRETSKDTRKSIDNGDGIYIKPGTKGLDITLYGTKENGATIKMFNAQDNTEIKNISNDSDAPTDLTKWSVPVRLVGGPNQFQLQAIDAAGNSSALQNWAVYGTNLAAPKFTRLTYGDKEQKVTGGTDYLEILINDKSASLHLEGFNNAAPQSMGYQYAYGTRAPVGGNNQITKQYTLTDGSKNFQQWAVDFGKSGSKYNEFTAGDGVYVYQFYAVDTIGGGHSATSKLKVTYDTTLPADPALVYVIDSNYDRHDYPSPKRYPDNCFAYGNGTKERGDTVSLGVQVASTDLVGYLVVNNETSTSILSGCGSYNPSELLIGDGHVRVDSNGQFELHDINIKPGSNFIYVVAIDAAGNISNRNMRIQINRYKGPSITLCQTVSGCKFNPTAPRCNLGDIDGAVLYKNDDKGTLNLTVGITPEDDTTIDKDSVKFSLTKVGSSTSIDTSLTSPPVNAFQSVAVTAGTTSGLAHLSLSVTDSHGVTNTCTAEIIVAGNLSAPSVANPLSDYRVIPLTNTNNQDSVLSAIHALHTQSLAVKVAPSKLRQNVYHAVWADNLCGASSFTNNSLFCKGGADGLYNTWTKASNIVYRQISWQTLEDPAASPILPLSVVPINNKSITQGEGASPALAVDYVDNVHTVWLDTNTYCANKQISQIAYRKFSPVERANGQILNNIEGIGCFSGSITNLKDSAPSITIANNKLHVVFMRQYPDASNSSVTKLAYFAKALAASPATQWEPSSGDLLKGLTLDTSANPVVKAQNAEFPVVSFTDGGNCSNNNRTITKKNLYYVTLTEPYSPVAVSNPDKTCDANLQVSVHDLAVDISNNRWLAWSYNQRSIWLAVYKGNSSVLLAKKELTDLLCPNPDKVQSLRLESILSTNSSFDVLLTTNCNNTALLALGLKYKDGDIQTHNPRDHNTSAAVTISTGGSFGLGNNFSLGISPLGRNYFIGFNEKISTSPAVYDAYYLYESY